MGEILDGQKPYGIHLLGGNHSCIEAPYMVYNRETGYCNLFLSLGGQDVNTVGHVSVPLEFRGDHTVTGGMNDSFGYDGEGRVSLTLGGVEYHGICDVGYDSGQDTFASTFTPMSGDGRTLWGVRATGQQ